MYKFLQVKRRCLFYFVIFDSSWDTIFDFSIKKPPGLERNRLFTFLNNERQ